MVQGSGGQTYLVVNDLPANTVALQVNRIDSDVQFVYPEGFTNDTAYNLTFYIAVTNLVNGLYAMNDYEAPLDKFAHDYYDWYVQAVNANGSLGPAVLVDEGYTPPPVGGTTNNWAT